MSSPGTSAKNSASTCSTVAIARGASRPPRLVTRSRRARIGGVDLALDEALTLEAAQHLRGHLDVGSRLHRQPDLCWALALFVQPPGAGEQHELGDRINLSLQLAKTPVMARDQMHLGLYSDDTSEQVERLLSLGATMVRVNNAVQSQPNDCLSVVRVGFVPTKGVVEAARGIDLEEFTREVEHVAVGRLHGEAIGTPYADVELDLGGREPMGRPPLR